MPGAAEWRTDPGPGVTVSRPVVIATRRLPGAVERELSDRFEARLNDTDRPPTETSLRSALAEADGILCTVSDPFTADAFGSRKPRTKILANFGVGYNHIDLAAAGAAGITITNTPGVLTEDTADLAIALVLASARRMSEGERELRAGLWTGWRPTHLIGTRVSGKTLGIVGFGRIGRAVARRAVRGFGMRVLYATRSDHDDAEAAELGAEARPLDGLLRESDFVSLHVPSKPDTRNLIDARALSLMQSHAFLINTSRGDVVDETALIRALEGGAIAGAGLDVYRDEPEVPEALLALPNAVLLPHLGSATEESRVAMGMRAIENLTAFFDGGVPPDLVKNVPG